MTEVDGLGREEGKLFEKLVEKRKEAKRTKHEPREVGNTEHTE